MKIIKDQSEQEQDRFSIVAFLVLILALFILLLGKNFLNASLKRQRTEAYDRYWRAAGIQGPRIGVMNLLSSSDSMSNLDLDNSEHSEGRGSQYFKKQDRLIGYSGMSSDIKDYFANSFFTKQEPFKIKNPWLAYYALFHLTRYKHDLPRFGYADLWLTGKETLYSGGGDCEDLSILLSDWLISSGYDARVVAGMYYNFGHAWVVLFLEDKSYILDLTWRNASKKKVPRTSVFPLYKPNVMFNREYLWTSTKRGFHFDYSDNNWVKTARFISAEKNPEKSKT